MKLTNVQFFFAYIFKSWIFEINMIQTIAKGINFLAGGILGGKNFCRIHWLLTAPPNIDKNYLDYVRLSTLELVSNEINKNALAGNVAELGVYKGNLHGISILFSREKAIFIWHFWRVWLPGRRKEKTKSFSSGEQDF